MKYIFTLLLLTSFEVSANCQTDIKKFCSGVKSGQGLILKCLHDNIASVSRACASELRQSVSDEDKKNPCHNDLREFCGDMPLEADKLGLCLLKNERKLSSNCADDFKSKKTKIVSANQCANETVEYCYDALKGPDSRVTRCLVRNRSKAAPACAKSLDSAVAKMKEKNSCFDDIEKHCANSDKPSDIQICLEQKKANLSPKCQAAVDKQIQKIKSNPCFQDLNTICKTAMTFQNKMKCLSVNKDKLSPACKANRNEREAKVKKIVTACESDRQKFCSLQPKNVGKITGCLKRNKTKLSAQCRAVL